VTPCSLWRSARRLRIADDDPRLSGERARDCDALLQASGKLDRLCAEEAFVEAHRLGELPNALVSGPALQTQELLECAADDAPHGEPAIQRRVGVLEDDLDGPHLICLALADPPREWCAVEFHLRADVRLAQAEEQPREGCLAAPGLADEPECLALAQDDGHILERPYVVALLAKGLADVLGLEDDRAAAGSRHGSSPGGRGMRELMYPLVEVAAARAPAAELEELRLLLAADLLCQAAAVDEDAGREVGAQLGQVPGNRVEPLHVLADARAWYPAQQPDRVRVPGILEDLARRSLLDEAAGVEDADLLAHAGDDAEVVADEEDARLELPPEGVD
jgi:hypothetical protein